MWSDKYIGIPFLANGRSTDGLDCWGLVRLILGNEFSIELPSFSDNYNIDDNTRITELVAQYKEGWERKEVAEPGDCVLFNILGEPMHIGVMLDNNRFIHVREGSDTVVDSITSTKWDRRVEGIYRYTSNAVLNAVPNPLKTERVTLPIPPGSTITDLVALLDKRYEVTSELYKRIIIMVNGALVPQEQWSSTIIKNSDSIEYRALPGKDAIRMVLVLIVIYYAPFLANYLAGGSFLVAAGATGAAIGGFAGFALTAAVTMVGMALVNVIAPVRPPTAPADPGSSTQQLMVTGGANPYSPYSAIPVILGRVRITPPLGAKNFVEYPDDTKVVLNMLLVWGYGPLTIDESTLKIGEVPITNYDLGSITVAEQGIGTGVNSIAPILQTYPGIITFDRKTSISVENQKIFDSIYGKDVDQLASGLELTGDDLVYANKYTGDTVQVGPNKLYGLGPSGYASNLGIYINSGEIVVAPPELAEIIDYGLSGGGDGGAAPSGPSGGDGGTGGDGDGGGGVN
jgi:sulfur carrier protein ThiS